MTDTPIITTEHEVMESEITSTNPPQSLNLDAAKASLEEVAATGTSISELKKHINAVIDSIAQNSSLFTRAAKFWGTTPLWQKIAIGTVLTLPTLILGIVFQMVIPFVVCALTLATYIPTSIVLDNHYNNEEKITEKLKEKMVVVADALEAVIQALIVLRIELANQIEKFHQENNRLTSGINKLQGRIEELTRQGVLLKQDAEELRAIQVQLENKNLVLMINVEEQTLRLEKNHNDIEQTRKNIDLNQEQLSDTVIEFDAMKSELGAHIEKATQITEQLEKAIVGLSATTFKKESDRKIFLGKLTEFLSDKEATFARIAEGFSQSEKELSLAKDELNRYNQLNKELLEQNNAQLKRMDAVTERLTEQLQVPVRSQGTIKQGEALRNLGIHAHNRKKLSSAAHNLDHPAQQMVCIP